MKHAAFMKTLLYVTRNLWKKQITWTNIRLTHSVEQRCADQFDNEVVLQAQFLQIFIKVIWVQKQTNHYYHYLSCVTLLRVFIGGHSNKIAADIMNMSGSVLLTLTVHFNDFIQAGENSGQLHGGQELFSLQRLGEDHLKDAQHPHVGVLSCKQLWEWTGNRKWCRTLGCQCSLLTVRWVDLFSVPFMTSCLFVSFLLRPDRASGEASSLQLGGSCSNSRRRGSISSSCGEGLVGEWLWPSGTKTGPSKLKSI